jgi:hypothetical protein
MTERTLEALTDEEWEMIEIIRENRQEDGFRLLIERKDGAWVIRYRRRDDRVSNHAHRLLRGSGFGTSRRFVVTRKFGRYWRHPAESGQICSVGRSKIAKKIAKNERCYANTLRPCSRMLLKVMKGG